MIIGNKIRHYINGLDLGEPRNWEELEIVIDWLNKREDVNINITDLEFVLKANKYLQKRVLDGLSGGVGIFEGEPYTIKIGDPASPVYTFDGYLDFTDETTIIGGEELVCSLKKKKGTDWLNDVADGFSFAYLHDKGVITNSDFIKVPYIINYVPDNMQVIVLSISLYMMTKELIENVRELAYAIADVTDASTPIVGVSLAGPVTGYDIGNFILVVLKTIAKIIYIIAITIAIIKLIEEIIEQILPKQRNHLGMKIRTLFVKGCSHLGLEFVSSIPELDWVHIPQKDKKGESSGEVGFPSNTSPIYTFGDCIRVFKEMFNADFRIKDGVFYFERKDNFEITSTYSVPNYFNDQERLLDRVQFNTDEIISNYNINWQYDVQDQNTLDNQEGRVFQAITTPNTTINADLVSIKNLAQINIPFALGRKKERLTNIEEIVKDLCRFVDNMTGVLGGGGTNLTSKITGRLGSLLLSSHFITVGKIVKMSGGKLASNQRTELSALNLWKNYHYINSFAEVDGKHNQYWRYKELRVPMSLSDFNKVLENNIVTDSSGNKILIEKIVYKPQEGAAIIDYRINKKYTNNLKIEYVT